MTQLQPVTNIISFPCQQQQKAIAFWIEEFERDYFTRRARTPKAETTWKLDYKAILKRLPPDEPLTSQVLMNLALSFSPDSKGRKRSCMVLSRLAKFAGIPCDLKSYAGTYSPKKVRPRSLPDDKAIVHQYECISTKEWCWVYGMLATYGLRPHEVFHLDFERFTTAKLVRIIDGKTGPRTVFPLYPEWVERFNLLDIRLPKCTGKTNSDLGARVTRAFNRLEIPFRAYDLRHCWAVRSLEFGVEVSLAAQLMGHSVKVHTDIYHAWISEQRLCNAFDLIVGQRDRPTAPI